MNDFANEHPIALGVILGFLGIFTATYLFILLGVIYYSWKSDNGKVLTAFLGVIFVPILACGGVAVVFGFLGAIFEMVNNVLQ